MNPNGPKAFLLAMQGKVRLEENGVIDHQQRYSRLGLMITWPFCIHVWLFWKKQVYAYDQLLWNGEPADIPGTGHWVPGSELGIYMRTPGWRYDADLGMKPTFGYIGMHWD